MESPEKSGNAIFNDDIRLFLEERASRFFSSHEYPSMVDMPAYIQTFRKWIQSSRLNTVLGLEDYPLAHVSLGVTQALDEFHYQILLEGRRLRMFRGEYPYHRDVHPFEWQRDFLDDQPLLAGDAVVLSLPFSGTGDPHPQTQELLDAAHQLGVPVLLDLAWFGTCGGLTFDLRHPGISQVAFSLTKGLTCGNYRSGIRFVRESAMGVSLKRKVDRLELHQEWNHSIHLNLMIGRELMAHFGPDTQYAKYRAAQLEVCADLQIEPSSCVHIARGPGPKWESYSRDGVVNRLNIRQLVKKRQKAKEKDESASL